MTYPTKSPKARAICHPRWIGWVPKAPDPCDGCPLFVPCVRNNTVTGLEQFTRWVEGINAAAEEFRA